MPEEIELETQDSQERVHKHLEEAEEGGGWIRWVAMTTALFAVIAAVAALLSGGAVNQALMDQVLAGQLQAQASDQWAFFQAKGIKGSTAAATADIISDPVKSDKYKAEADRYKSEQGEISAKAKELEKQRDEKNELAERMMHKHHTFAYCVTFTQVSIALSAIAALTRRKPVWLGSLVVGCVGLAYLFMGLAK